jgi:hypothetical protein
MVDCGTIGRTFIGPCRMDGEHCRARERQRRAGGQRSGNEAHEESWKRDRRRHADALSYAIRRIKDADSRSGQRRARRLAARYVVTTPGERTG